MDIKIGKSALVKALSHLTQFVEKKSVVPIYSHVLFDVTDHLTLSGTDSDIGGKARVSCDIEQTGSTSVAASTLFDVVRKMPDGDIRLKVDGDIMYVSSGRSKFKLATLPASDFPEVMKDFEGARVGVFEKRDLMRVLDKTRFAICSDETRYYLDGVYMHIHFDDGKGPSLRFVSTDGHRLALVSTDVIDGLLGMEGIIIPKKAVGIVRKLLDNVEGPITMTVYETALRIEADNVVIQSRLIDGTFPDYSRIIPQDNNLTIDVSTDLLREASDRVSTISFDKTSGIVMSMGQGEMTLSVRNGGDTISKEIIAANDCTLEGSEVGVNSRYLADVLSVIESDNVVMYFREANSNIVDGAAPIMVTDIADPDSQYIVMPQRV